MRKRQLMLPGNKFLDKSVTLINTVLPDKKRALASALAHT